MLHYTLTYYIILYHSEDRLAQVLAERAKAIAGNAKRGDQGEITIIVIILYYRYIVLKCIIAIIL